MTFLEPISERVREQMVDVAVPQSVDGTVDVVKRIWHEHSQQRAVEETVVAP